MVQTLNKWGNSLGLRIPESIAREKNRCWGQGGNCCHRTGHFGQTTKKKNDLPGIGRFYS